MGKKSSSKSDCSCDKKGKKKSCSCKDECSCAPRNFLLLKIKAQLELELCISECYQVTGKFKFPAEVEICASGCWSYLIHKESVKTSFAFSQCGVGPWLSVQTFIANFASLGLNDKLASVAAATNEANALFQQQWPLTNPPLI